MKVCELFELYQEESSTFEQDGKQYDLNKLFKITDKFATRKFKVDDLKWILLWDKPDEERLKKANPNVPILVTYKDNKLVVVDGLHRLKKAVDKGWTHIEGKFVYKDVLDKCLIAEAAWSTPLKTSNVTLKKPPVSKGKQLGAGVQGYVRSHSRPNTVVKVALLVDNDPYEEFLKMILRHQDNPFFPRIHSVKKYNLDYMNMGDYLDLMDMIGQSHNMMSRRYLDKIKYLVIVVMEKLVPFDSIDEDVVYSILSQLVANNTEVSMDYIDHIYQMVMDLADPDNRKYIMTHTPNKKLADALRLLGVLWKKFQSDMHLGNVMFRLTNVGPQLVIVDPVYDERMGHYAFM